LIEEFAIVGADLNKSCSTSLVLSFCGDVQQRFHSWGRGMSSINGGFGSSPIALDNDMVLASLGFSVVAISGLDYLQEGMLARSNAGDGETSVGRTDFSIVETKIWLMLIAAASIKRKGVAQMNTLLDIWLASLVWLSE
jgi:hypothetical protein